MTIAKDILVQSLPSVEGLPPVPQQKIQFPPKVLAKAKSSVYMIKSAMTPGCDNSSKPKAKKSRPILSTKTIWALFLWQRMAMSPVLKEPNISKQNTSSFVISTIQENLIFNIVLPNTSGQSSLPNLSKVPSFASCILSWWIARLITLKIMLSPLFLRHFLCYPRTKFLLPLQNIISHSYSWTNLLTYWWRSDLFNPLLHLGCVLRQSVMVLQYLVLAVHTSTWKQK